MLPHTRQSESRRWHCLAVHSGPGEEAELPVRIAVPRFTEPQATSRRRLLSTMHVGGHAGPENPQAAGGQLLSLAARTAPTQRARLAHRRAAGLRGERLHPPRRGTLCKRSAARASPRAGSPASAPSWTPWPTPSSAVPWTAGPIPYLWLDALTQKVREDGRIVNVSVAVATGVNREGKREVLGIDVGTSEDGAFWLAFLRSLTARGLSGIQW